MQGAHFGVLENMLANTTVNGTLSIADGSLSSHNSHAVTRSGKTD